MPAPYGSRVRNALKAEAKSVRLSSLVGAGGMWYGFGSTMAEMYAELHSKRPNLPESFDGSG
ncbi:hypothetical protein HWV62_7800 [Athelia sp. TMB]|nr:hypothetical protein HWV62_7800 [Athelia sp. TMB]